MLTISNQTSKPASGRHFFQSSSAQSSATYWVLWDSPQLSSSLKIQVVSLWGFLDSPFLQQEKCRLEHMMGQSVRGEGGFLVSASIWVVNSRISPAILN